MKKKLVNFNLVIIFVLGLVIQAFYSKQINANNVIDNTDLGIVYVGSDWHHDTNLDRSCFLNGDYMWTSEVGAKIQFNFTGTFLEIYCQPWNQRSNNVQVKIDGVVVGNYSQYGDSNRKSILMYEIRNLSDTRHFVELQSTDSSRMFAFDYFKTDGDVSAPIEINDDIVGNGNNQIEYSQNCIGWYYNNNQGQYQDDETSTSSPGAQFQVKFDGKRVKWYGAKDSQSGRSAVYIDGQYVKDIDCYNTVRLEEQLLFDSGVLNPGSHTLTVMVLPFKNPSSSGNSITVDKIGIY